MIVIGSFILGVVLGVSIARKRGGKLPDMAQYASGYGIAFALLGLFATIFLDRMI